MNHNTNINLLKQQQKVHEKAFEDRIKNSSVEMWLNNDNADYWGNTLPLQDLKKTFSVLKNKTILTLGDGKGGKDGVFFKNLGHDVTVSDIAVSVLKEAKNRNIIDKYLKLDSENIDLENNSFDFVITKETLHHLPRPYLGLYEMLRVAKEAIVIIEPRIKENIYNHTIPNKNSYEISGNFLFRFSPYEIIQIARSYGAVYVAYKFCRIFSTTNAGNIKNQELKTLIMEQNKIFEQEDKLNDVSNKGLISFIIWKKKPNKEIIKSLKTENFITIDTSVPLEITNNINTFLKTQEIE
ncbi:class I SAM-dependent methyltransferase [Aliarcobacter cryaerophilus]|uniref:class I SAM-dependent methyltransferase n=1 Tax=Aliarcobacter cryaerophilus TaxID=28198 RepID=UPI0021B4F9DF|nr:class I SAM-dependent methyltransferase [Aliarcobacter cryaerophilus]MCT7528306.1 class I SAM-dependent methyltransferase [Aliarcobacter cryaerophilus]